MRADFVLTVHDVPPERDAALIDDGIGRSNDERAPLGDVRPLAAFVADAAGRTLGGAVGRTWGECCELQLLWVEDGQRGSGIGSALMRAFEQRAIERGCRIAYLDTFSFQAPDFYRRHGYAVAMQIEGFAPGIVRYTMTRARAGRRMTAGELERYLHAHIPLSRAMQVSVVEAEADRVTLAAPLAPNINHRDTVFGGSASAIAILSAWSLVHTRLARSGRAARLVIQRNTMAYDEAVVGAFGARAAIADPADWDAFVRLFDRRGRGRIRVNAELLDAQGRKAGAFEGEFVALPQPAGPAA